MDKLEKLVDGIIAVWNNHDLLSSRHSSLKMVCCGSSRRGGPARPRGAPCRR